MKDYIQDAAERLADLLEETEYHIITTFQLYKVVPASVLLT